MYQPDHRGLFHRQSGNAAAFFGLGVFFDDQYGKAADDQRPRHDDGIFQHHLNDVAKGEAQNDGRKEGKEQIAYERDRSGLQREQPFEDIHEGPPIENNHGKDRPRLDCDIEDCPAARVISQQLGRQNEVTGGGYREKFGQTLDNAEDDCNQPIRHACASAAASVDVVPKRPCLR